MIIVRKNILKYNDTTFKCATGKNGISCNKVEGDGCTPTGIYSIEKIYYRADKVVLPNLDLPTIAINKNFGWCDDVDSQDYNKLIKFPFEPSAEVLFRDDDIYDILCVMNYNRNPIIKNKGSAIFMHISRHNYASTEGCVALKKGDLNHILTKINIETIINIID